MDNWMAPRAFGAGSKGKPARQGKSSSAQAQTTAVGASGEEAGAGPAMGLLKRKRTTPPESPAPNKKRVSEDAEVHKTSSSEPVEGTQKKIQPGKTATPLGDARVSKQLFGQSTEVATVEPAAEDAARLRFEKDVNALQSRIPAVVENVSYGQGTSFGARSPSEAVAPATVPGQDGGTQSPATPHVVPSHAGWFQWARIHQLERSALPEYFSVKEDSKKTPELYMEHRSIIMKKYRENPQKLLKLEDVQGLLTGDSTGAASLFGFLDHWGLINYQAITDFSPFSSSRGLLASGEETNNGALALSPHVKPALTHLFNFEATLAPAHKQLSISSSPASNLPISSLADAAVQESLAAPAVEYHCNSCQADCSKRRYHCQKQADFDLCPDCYSDGKFGQGMTGTDFLRMDALTELADANGGGWSDQETLLLLEALELYGENWTEIAEHVATKSKAQCILHFIRLPIEDPFLEDMEASNSVSTVQPPATVVSNDEGVSSLNDKDAQIKGAQKNIASGESIDEVPSNSEQDAAKSTEETKKDRVGKNGNDDSEPSSMKTEENIESDSSKGIVKGEESSDTQALLLVSESAGCTGPEGLIAFADAGNPVMTQVAFLGAMVSPRVAAAAAQAALKSLAEDDPVGFLSVKNSFTLNGSDDKDRTSESVCPERPNGQQSTENQLVSSTVGTTTSSDSNSASKAIEDKMKEKTCGKETAGTLEKAPGQEALESQKPQVTAPTNAPVAEQDVPSVAKVRSAAVNALASAAVKAKLLADQEEQEIRRLVTFVIENQLKKVELKLKHFTELESMLGKECEQAEKARAKVYAERARIMASRLGAPSSVSQLQSTSSSGGSYSKTSSHSVNLVAQPRPAVFTFGPTGASAPAAGYATTSGVDSSSPMPASASSQQGVTPQRPPRAVSGTSLAMGAKE